MAELNQSPIAESSPAIAGEGDAAMAAMGQAVQQATTPARASVPQDKSAAKDIVVPPIINNEAAPEVAAKPRSTAKQMIGTTLVTASLGVAGYIIGSWGDNKDAKSPLGKWVISGLLATFGFLMSLYVNGKRDQRQYEGVHDIDHARHGHTMSTPLAPHQAISAPSLAVGDAQYEGMMQVDAPMQMVSR
jgi:hypothetical protein